MTKEEACALINDVLNFSVTRSENERLYQFCFGMNDKKIHIQEVVRSDILVRTEYPVVGFIPRKLCDVNSERSEPFSEILDESSLKLALKKIGEQSSKICNKCVDEILNK